MDDKELIEKYSKGGFTLSINDGWLKIKAPNTKNYSQISGRYMFYSPNREALIKVALQVMKELDLHSAKIPSDGHTIWKDAVLCIYDEKNRFQDKTRQNEKLDCTPKMDS